MRPYPEVQKGQSPSPAHDGVHEGAPEQAHLLQLVLKAQQPGLGCRAVQKPARQAKPSGIRRQQAAGLSREAGHGVHALAVALLLIPMAVCTKCVPCSMRAVQHVRLDQACTCLG